MPPDQRQPEYPSNLQCYQTCAHNIYNHDEKARGEQPYLRF